MVLILQQQYQNILGRNKENHLTEKRGMRNFLILSNVTVRRKRAFRRQGIHSIQPKTGISKSTEVVLVKVVYTDQKAVGK